MLQTAQHRETIAVICLCCPWYKQYSTSTTFMMCVVLCHQNATAITKKELREKEEGDDDDEVLSPVLAKNCTSTTVQHNNIHVVL
jgi:hypothetical protein